MRHYSSSSRLLMVFLTLPQTIVGAILVAFYAITKQIDYIEKYPPNIDGCYIVYLRNKNNKIFSLSMGLFIIIKKEVELPFCLQHEYGHYILNKYLFWFYLPLIGIPSLIMYWIHKDDENFEKVYYSKYPEFIADRLGGVKRY